jgi:hypothetical protein
VSYDTVRDPGRNRLQSVAMAKAVSRNLYGKSHAGE